MADLNDGKAMLEALADLDWYGANARELSDKLGWDYQKTLRTLKDLQSCGWAHQQGNQAWRLSARIFELLTRAFDGYMDRLNQVIPQRIAVAGPGVKTVIEHAMLLDECGDELKHGDTERTETHGIEQSGESAVAVNE